MPAVCHVSSKEQTNQLLRLDLSKAKLCKNNPGAVLVG